MREALEYFATLRELPLHARTESVVVALRAVGLEAVASKRIGTLSSGARRRLVLAQGIVSRPRLLIVDESRELGGWLGDAHIAAIHRELAAAGTAILVATRALDSLVGAATRALRLADGVVTPLDLPMEHAAATRGSIAQRPSRVAELAPGGSSHDALRDETATSRVR